MVGFVLFSSKSFISRKSCRSTLYSRTRKATGDWAMCAALLALHGWPTDMNEFSLFFDILAGKRGINTSILRLVFSSVFLSIFYNIRKLHSTSPICMFYTKNEWPKSLYLLPWAWSEYQTLLRLALSTSSLSHTRKRCYENPGSLSPMYELKIAKAPAFMLSMPFSPSSRLNIYG
jgi:hypothetical protein